MLRMWKEHCIKCNNCNTTSCDHMVTREELLEEISAYKKMSVGDPRIRLKSLMTYEEVWRYERVLNMTDVDFSEIIKDKPFQFAKTLKHNPHYYTLLKKWSNRELWFDIVLFLKLHSGIEYFYSTPYEMYFSKNGYKYWMMDPTLETTDLINRKEINADKN